MSEDSDRLETNAMENLRRPLSQEVPPIPVIVPTSTQVNNLNRATHDYGGPVQFVIKETTRLSKESGNLPRNSRKGLLENPDIRLGIETADLLCFNISPGGEIVFRGTFADAVSKAATSRDLERIAAENRINLRFAEEIASMDKTEAAELKRSVTQRVAIEKAIKVFADTETVNSIQMINFIQRDGPRSYEEVIQFLGKALPVLSERLIKMGNALRKAGTSNTQKELSQNLNSMAEHTTRTSRSEVARAQEFVSYLDPNNETVAIPDFLVNLDLAEELRNLTADAKRSELAKNKNFTFDADPPIITIDGNPFTLPTALLNLITNAGKYAESEVYVSVTKIEPESPNILVIVADNGKGISSEEQEKIFQDGYQAEGAVSSTGLGLGTAKEYIERHRGIVGVRSVPGRGSAFFALLPPTRDDSTITQEDLTQEILDKIDSQREVLFQEDI